MPTPGVGSRTPAAGRDRASQVATASGLGLALVDAQSRDHRRTTHAPPSRVRRLRDGGVWPVHQYLDTRLDQDHGLAIDAVLESMPPGLFRVYTPVRPESVVALRVAGLMQCERADKDVVLFLRALRWCVGKERAFRPPSPTATEQLQVTSAQLREDWADDGANVNSLMLAKVYALLGTEWFYASLSGSGDEWALGMPNNIRDFRGVETIDEYLRVVGAQEAQPSPINPLLDLPSGERGGVVVSEPNGGRRAAGEAVGIAASTRVRRVLAPVRRLSLPRWSTGRRSGVA
jgi:hypothetical protein